MHNDDVAHEESDINIRAVLTSTVVVGVVCIVTGILMYFLFWHVLESQAAARDPRLSPLVKPPTEMPKSTIADPTFGSAPEPRLLTNEPTYLRGQREQWNKDLHGFGSTDQSGAGRIPIEAAKEILLQRGLPTRADPLQDPRLGTHAPAYGESSSGRTITRALTAGASEAVAAPAEQKTEPPKNPADHGKGQEHK
jgi:hypothetical protein